MTTITLRDTKGSPLTHEEMDDNFSNLNEASIPAGGTEGQVLVKDSSTDYDVVWGPTADSSRIITTCKNNSTTTSIPKGTPVYVVSAVGMAITVAPADAADSAKMPAIGVVNETIAPEEEGDLIILGFIQGVNTSSFTEGDYVYVASGGGYTNVKPTASDVEIQFLGVVIKVDSTNGSGFITGTGLNDLLRYNSSATTFQGWNGTAWVPVTDLVSDTSPQLGGALDVNGQSIVSVSNGNITFAPNGSGVVVVGNGANIATLSSNGETNLLIKTGSGFGASVLLEDGFGANYNINSGAFGKVLVGNELFANTAIVSSSGTQSLTLNTNSGNTASIVLQSGPSANILLETGIAGSLLLGNQSFANTAILSSSGTQSLTLNTNSGNTASVVIQSGPSANLQLQSGFAGRVTIDNQLFGNTAILSSSGAQSLTLNTNSGNTASVVLQSGPSANLQLQTGFAGRVTIDNQLFGNTAILSSSGTQSLTLNTNSGNTASVVIQSGASAEVKIETGLGGKVTIGNQVFGNTAILSSSGSQALTLQSNSGNTASVILQSGPTANVTLQTGFAGKVLIGNQFFANTAIISGNGSQRLTLESGQDILLNPTGNSLVNKAILTRPLYSIGTTSGTISPTPSNGQWQTITLNGNLTLNDFTSASAGHSINLIITQDATGSRTLTSSMKWEGGSKTLSTAANAVDIASIYYDGTDYWASLTKGYA